MAPVCEAQRIPRRRCNRLLPSLQSALGWWFLPPRRDDTGGMTLGVGGGTLLDRTEIFDLVFGSSAAVGDRLAALATSPVFA